MAVKETRDLSEQEARDTARVIWDTGKNKNVEKVEVVKQSNGKFTVRVTEK